MDSDSLNCLIGLGIVLGIAWLAIVNYPAIERILQSQLDNSLDREIEDKTDQPLHEIFLEFDHESTSAWLKWMESREDEVKNIAYQKIWDYLSGEPETLGSVTGDAIKAITAFKRPETYRLILDLVIKVREKFMRFKTLDLFYQEAVSSLMVIDESEAIPFLAEEISNYESRSDADKMQQYILRALAKSDELDLLSPIFVRTVLDAEIDRVVKADLVFLLEKKNSIFRRKVYTEVFKALIQSPVNVISEDDQQIFEQIFHNSKKFFIKDDFDKDLWDCILKLCDLPKLRTLFIKLVSSFLANGEEELLREQICVLIEKNEPAKSSFREAMAKRYKITSQELETIKLPYKKEDLVFEKDSTVTVEKSKKTKSVTHELLDTYHLLDKVVFSNEISKLDRSLGMVSLIHGSSSMEKIYLLRALAANANITFIYINYEQLIRSNFEVANLKNSVNNCKPCIVYFDSMESILVKPELDKVETLHLKELMKVLKELSQLAGVHFFGNLPYNKDSLKQENPELHTMVNSNLRGYFRLVLPIDRPDAKEKERILRDNQNKMSIERMKNPERYDANSILSYAQSMSILEFLYFLTQYFEFSLFAYGELIPLNEFIEESKFVLDLSNLEPDSDVDLSTLLGV